MASPYDLEGTRKSIEHGKSTKELQRTILKLQHKITQLEQRVRTLEILMVRLGE